MAAIKPLLALTFADGQGRCYRQSAGDWTMARRLVLIFWAFAWLPYLFYDKPLVRHLVHNPSAKAHTSNRAHNRKGHT